MGVLKGDSAADAFALACAASVTLKRERAGQVNLRCQVNLRRQEPFSFIGTVYSTRDTHD
jgi:hypothetical protein